MIFSSSQKQSAGRLLLAAVLLSALAGFVGSKMLPDTPLYAIVLYSAIGMVALLAVLILVIAVTATIRQFILRIGGTDTQWLWFPSEPRGLVQLRANARLAKTPRMSMD